MTREEAIAILIRERDEDLFMRTEYREQIHEALNMAIKALEQELSVDIAQERYKDLCEYFGDSKDILKSREDFKAWLGRVKWHIRKAEELYEKYEYKQEPCGGANANQHNSNALNDIGQRINALEDYAISKKAVTDTTICVGISCNECSFNTCEDGQPGCLLKERVDKLPPVKPQEPKWIPVSDRLPEEIGTYMTTVDYEEYGIAVGQRYYHGKWLGWEDDCVIAWMPLPKPYDPQKRSK